MNIPNHVAIIPDGNRRWAKNRGLAAFIGHRKGAERFEELLTKALELNIKFLTFWGASLDNVTKRPKEEVTYLFEIFEDYFNRLADEPKVHEAGVRIRVLGKWEELFPESLKDAIRKVIKKTKDYSNHGLTFLMAYNGTDEMIECMEKLKKNDQKITDEAIKNNLWTFDLPAVDFLIRTGCEGDPHSSAGFMMWDTAYSQLFFSEKYFPDFGVESFEKSMIDFSKRERRTGK
ncbi:MAG: polyprenyl diphosphate synthase [Candidatus Paceibacterota bacterium]|jgi:undecaprenyl diphosphate synthase|nr:polyprenyl diphosphate synthase [bacterium]